LSLGTVGGVDCVGIADAELLLAEESWHGLLVELETRCRVIGGTCASEVEGGRVALVCCGRLATEEVAGVEFSFAPLSSSRGIDG